MSLKFYFDSHISKRAAVQLRDRGVDVVHCDDVGLSHASDTEHLEYTTRDNRAVVTHDRDFLRLYDKWMELGKDHGGVIFVNERSQGNIGLLVNELFVYYELIDRERYTELTNFYRMRSKNGNDRLDKSNRNC